MSGFYMGADDEVDGRGVVKSEFAEQVRKTRAAEQWERVDSIVIGPTAGDRSKGWFNSWADFASAEALQLFQGRDAQVGSSYVNQTSERTDWAQDLYQTGIEFVVAPGLAEFMSDSNDAALTQYLFKQLLPHNLTTSIVLAESDEIARMPASHFSAGYGNTGMFSDAAGSTVTQGGTMGVPHISNGWQWPEAIMLAAKANLKVNFRVDQPIREALRVLPGPGYINIPTSGGGTYQMPLWYQIRMFFRGPRYLQLRGARSSA